MSKRPTIVIKPREGRRARAGAPWIFSNEIVMEGAAKALPPGNSLVEVGDKLITSGLGGRFPDVLWDGYYNKDRKVDGKPAGGPQICLRDVNGVINADGPGGYKNPSKDAKQFACELPRLPAVDLGRG